MTKNKAENLTQIAKDIFLVYLDMLKENLRAGYGWPVCVREMIPIATALEELTELTDEDECTDYRYICELAKKVINGCVEEINDCC